MSNPNPQCGFTKGDPAAKEAGAKGGHGKKGKMHFKTALINTLKKEIEKAKAGDKKAVTPEMIIKSWLVTSMRNPAMAKIILELAGELKIQVEHSGPDGTPIEIKNTPVEKLSNEQLAKIAAGKDIEESESDDEKKKKNRDYINTK